MYEIKMIFGLYLYISLYLVDKNENRPIRNPIVTIYDYSYFDVPN